MNARLSDPLNRLRFVGMKLLTTCAFVALPIALHGWKLGLALPLVTHLVCGEYLAILFIVNHISESVVFFTKGKPNAPNKPQEAQLLRQGERTKAAQTPPDNDWAVSQIKGCVNWSPSLRASLPPLRASLPLLRPFLPRLLPPSLHLSPSCQNPLPARTIKC